MLPLVSLCLLGIAYCGVDNGDVLLLGCCIAGNCGRSCDSAHKSNVLCSEALGYLIVDVVIKACVLVVDDEVGTLNKASVLETLMEPSRQLVERAVLAVLADADNGSGRILGAACADGKAKNNSKNYSNKLFHD